MTNHNKKECYVRNGSITYEIKTKGFDVKKGDHVVFFYNDRIRLATVVEKSIGEVQITGDNGYIINVVKNLKIELDHQRDELWNRLCKVRKILKNMYIDKVETNDPTIDLDNISKEYLSLKEQFDDVETKIKDWNSL